VAPAAPLPVSFAARDGRTLAGLLVMADSARGALSINAATGFSREFYLKFAAYAAQRGYHALVYDYRGMGKSALGPLAAERACMSDWGRLDMPGALDFLMARFPALPAFTLGHSVGGQLLGCLDNANRARAHVMVAAATAYWGRQNRPFRYLALTLWNLYGPLMLQLKGFLPQGALWTGQSLPPEVFRQWRRWGLAGARFGPALDERLAGSAFGEVHGPALALGFTDDPIATPAAVQALLSAYTQLRVEQRWTSPAQAGVTRIGHRGFFGQQHRDSLWRGTFDWLDRHAS
jgi:predicted alpha/beta hydrolase